MRITVEFPKPKAFWNDMGKCFLNALTFNSPGKEASVPFLDRAMISAWVRVDWIKGKHIGGFSEPPRKVNAFVSKAVTSNIPFAVVIIVVGCCIVLVADAVVIVCTNQVSSFALKDVMRFGAAGKQNHGEWVRVRTGERTWWELGSKEELLDNENNDAKTADSSASELDSELHGSKPSDRAKTLSAQTSYEESDGSYWDIESV